MRAARGAIIFLLGLPVAGILAQPAASQAQVAAAVQGKTAYDIVANCLMRQIAGRQFVAWPLVYAPPRQEALVNVWLRGREYEPPVAVFHVIQNADGMTRVTYEPTPGQPGPSKAAAEAAARRCVG